MKEDFYNYLKDVSASETVKTKVEQIYNEILSLYNNINIEDMLITNVINNGSIEWQSLWFFNDSFAIECKNFLSLQEDYDIAPLNNRVIYYNIKKSNYSFFEEPKANSIVFFTILINNGKTSCNFTATGINCLYAMKVSQKYFLKKMDASLYSE